MSDTEDIKPTATPETTEVVEIPPQKSATDTTNWDNKVSTDPNGEKYIRTTDEEE